MATFAPWGKTTLLVLLLLAALVLPRALTLPGLRYSSPLGFEDMGSHLLRLDVLHKQLTFAPAARDVPLRRHAPFYFTPSVNWPAGAYLAGLPWVGRFGPAGLWTTQLTMLPFFGLLLLALAALGRSLTRSWRVGLWVALLAALSPPLLGASWYFSLDLPLTALVWCGALLLLWSRRFSRLDAALAFGLCSALGLLVKPTYVFFLFPPALVALGLGLLRGPRRRTLAGAALALGALLLAAWFLGLLRLEPMLEVLRDHAASSEMPAAQRFARWSAADLLAYPRFIAEVLPWPLLLPLVPGLVLLHHRRRPLPGRPLWLALLWGSLLLLTLLPNKLERYALPLHPLLALLTVLGLRALLPRLLRLPALAGTLLLTGAVVLLCHQSPPPWPGGNPIAPKPLFNEGLDPNELALPSAEELRRLRQNGFHPNYWLEPLQRQMHEVVQRADPSGAVGVLFLDARRSGLRMPVTLCALLLAQAEPRRYIVSFRLEQAGVRPATLVVVHPTDLDLDPLLPRYQMRERRVLQRIQRHHPIEGDELNAAVSLLQYVPGPGARFPLPMVDHLPEHRPSL